jgi:hypothetical protein
MYLFLGVYGNLCCKFFCEPNYRFLILRSLRRSLVLLERTATGRAASKNSKVKSKKILQLLQAFDF